MTVVMRILIILWVAVLSGCATNGYEKYYSPKAGSEQVFSDPTIDRSSKEPRIYAHSADLNADAKRLTREGYLLLGTSSFYGPANKPTTKQAIKQGKKVGASLVMMASSYRDTLSGVVPYTIENPTQYATVNTTGTMNSPSSGDLSTYNSTSSVAIPGGYTTYEMPYSIDRNDFFASYWAKRDPKKIRLGANLSPLSNELRQKLQRNTGALVNIVVQGTPAFRANILEGDIILKINDVDVIDPKDLVDQIARLAGEAVTLAILRGNNAVVTKALLNP